MRRAASTSAPGKKLQLGADKAIKVARGLGLDR
jgi:hypothetical protein